MTTMTEDQHDTTNVQPAVGQVWHSSVTNVYYVLLRLDSDSWVGVRTAPTRPGELIEVEGLAVGRLVYVSSGFKPGNRVTVTEAGSHHHSSRIGDVFTVREFPYERRDEYDVSLTDPEDRDRGYVHLSALDWTNIVDPDEQAPTSLTTDSADVAELRRRLAQMEQQRDVALRTISAEFNRRAAEQNLCGQYDRAVRDINDQLPVGWELQTRETTWRVQQERTITIRYRYTDTVSALGEDEATEEASENWDEPELPDLEDGWEITSDTDWNWSALST